MDSPPVFKILEVTLIELEYALADFRRSTASLSESLNFVGLEIDLSNLTSATRRVIEAERAVQSRISGSIRSEIRIRNA